MLIIFLVPVVLPSLRTGLLTFAGTILLRLFRSYVLHLLSTVRELRIMITMTLV